MLVRMQIAASMKIFHAKETPWFLSSAEQHCQWLFIGMHLLISLERQPQEIDIGSGPVLRD